MQLRLSASHHCPDFGPCRIVTLTFYGLIRPYANIIFYVSFEFPDRLSCFAVTFDCDCLFVLSELLVRCQLNLIPGDA